MSTANNSAMSMAEGNPLYKMDVSVVFGGNEEREHVLRTSFDRISVWKSKYVGVNMSPFESRHRTMVKEAAMIDNEVWVFGINSTLSNDIVTAVEIAAEKFKVPPANFLRNIYVKNLNAEGENEMSNKALVDANKSLYKGVCKAIHEAAQKLNAKGELNLWVISSNINSKIPKRELHDSLKQGGADAVGVAKKVYQMESGNNEGTRKALVKTNLHLARFNLK